MIILSNILKSSRKMSKRNSPRCQKVLRNGKKTSACLMKVLRNYAAW